MKAYNLALVLLVSLVVARPQPQDQNDGSSSVQADSNADTVINDSNQPASASTISDQPSFSFTKSHFRTRSSTATDSTSTDSSGDNSSQDDSSDSSSDDSGDDSGMDMGDDSSMSMPDTSQASATIMDLNDDSDTSDSILSNHITPLLAISLFTSIYFCL